MSKHQGYCWPSLGEPCGNCHRCAPSCGDDNGDGICEHTHPQLWADGRALVQAILDRKNANDFGAWLERRKLPRVIGPEDWPTEEELRDDLTRRKTGRKGA